MQSHISKRIDNYIANVIVDRDKPKHLIGKFSTRIISQRIKEKSKQSIGIGRTFDLPHFRPPLSTITNDSEVLGGAMSNFVSRKNKPIQSANEKNFKNSLQTVSAGNLRRTQSRRFMIKSESSSKLALGTEEYKIKTDHTKSRINFSLKRTTDLSKLKKKQTDKFSINSTSSSQSPTPNVLSYGISTSNGLYRDYNEDRVSFCSRMPGPSEIVTDGFHFAFFGLFDGHGGHLCADYLRDNLHAAIINNRKLRNSPKSAIIESFNSLDKILLAKARQDTYSIDTSGSCAIIALFIGISYDINQGNKCYIANTGDSRGSISQMGGKVLRDLTNDHKPENIQEYHRVIQAGGSIYQNPIPQIRGTMFGRGRAALQTMGPKRISPGKLSVTRAFGDLYAKDPMMGGNNKVLIVEPEIFEFSIDSTTDLMVLSCNERSNLR